MTSVTGLKIQQKEDMLYGLKNTQRIIHINNI